MALRQVLSQYISSCRRALHDASGKFWTTADLTEYVNEGRSQTAAMTGCVRSLVTAYISSGVEMFTIGGVVGGFVTNSGSGYTTINVAVSGDGTGATATGTLVAGKLTAIVMTDLGSGYTNASFTITGDGASAAATAYVLTDDAIDIMNITVWWGNQRVPLRYMPFTEFNAKMRGWPTNTQQPLVWSRYGTVGGVAFMQPVPDQTYRTEFDLAVTTADLVSDSSVDELKYPYTIPVIDYACYKAKEQQQSFGEAERFEAKFKQKILMAQAAVQMRRIPNPNNGYSGAG